MALLRKKKSRRIQLKEILSNLDKISAPMLPNIYEKIIHSFDEDEKLELFSYIIKRMLREGIDIETINAFTEASPMFAIAYDKDRDLRYAFYERLSNSARKYTKSILNGEPLSKELLTVKILSKHIFKRESIRSMEEIIKDFKKRPELLVYYLFTFPSSHTKLYDQKVVKKILGYSSSFEEERNVIKVFKMLINVGLYVKHKNLEELYTRVNKLSTLIEKINNPVYNFLIIRFRFHDLYEKMFLGAIENVNLLRLFKRLGKSFGEMEFYFWYSAFDSMWHKLYILENIYRMLFHNSFSIDKSLVYKGRNLLWEDGSSTLYMVLSSMIHFSKEEQKLEPHLNYIIDRNSIKIDGLNVVVHKSDPIDEPSVVLGEKIFYPLIPARAFFSDTIPPSKPYEMFTIDVYSKYKLIKRILVTSAVGTPSLRIAIIYPDNEQALVSRIDKTKTILNKINYNNTISISTIHNLINLDETRNIFIKTKWNLPFLFT